MKKRKDFLTISFTKNEKQKGMAMVKNKAKRILISGVAATAIASSFVIPQVQVGASQFLSLFRVDQFEMVKLTQNDLQEIENWVSSDQAGTLDLKGIGKLEMTDPRGEEVYTLKQKKLLKKQAIWFRKSANLKSGE